MMLLCKSNLDSGTSTLSDEEVEGLRSALQGQILLAGDDGYEEARQIWNAMIDRRPALIVRCAGAADVVQCVNFVREHGLLTAVRGGGHNIAGNAICEGGFVIDQSQLKAVRVDADTRRATVEPGATLADLDRETQALGLAIPTGINSTTGVAGLTLGGGFGWLSRKYGLTIDALRSVDVVTAQGELLHASADQNADLFWGIRGGGGNLGVVTSFEFEAYPVGPELLSGLIVFPLAQAKSVLKQYREFVAKAPDELCIWVVLRKAPPLPFLPAEVHGKEVIVLAMCYAGDPAAGAKAIEPLRSFGDAYGEHIGPMPFTAWQQAFDPLLTPGARNYWKSHNFTELNDAAVDQMIEYAGKLPSPHCEIFIASLGGATSRVAPDATAYPHREAQFVLNVHGRWEDAAQDAAGVAWARDFFDATAPYATGGVYVNFMPEDETERVGAAYGPNFQRLPDLKVKFDPKNIFRLNQNVAPR